eukprot:COSAG06_NODE_59499_length_274_cov_0.577143_1_plen_58_part_01
MCRAADGHTADMPVPAHTISKVQKDDGDSYVLIAEVVLPDIKSVKEVDLDVSERKFVV